MNQGRHFFLTFAVFLLFSTTVFSGDITMKSFRAQTLTLSTGPIVIHERGEGPALVLLHSNPGNALDYSAVAPKLAHYFRVIIVDWPGYGVSPPPENPQDSSAMALYGTLVELMNALAVPSASFIGHSVGGYAAARYAIEYPDRVERLILVSSGGFTPHNLLTRLFSRLQGSSLSLPPPAFAKVYIHRHNEHSQSVVDRARTLHSSAEVKTVTRAVWRSFLSPDHDLSQAANAIHQPVLLVYGRSDPVIRSERDGRVAQTAIPHSDTLLLPCGHGAFFEMPTPFLDKAIPFLLGKTLAANALPKNLPEKALAMH